jgi:hypothetical protein
VCTTIYGKRVEHVETKEWSTVRAIATSTAKHGQTAVVLGLEGAVRLVVGSSRVRKQLSQVFVGGCDQIPAVDDGDGSSAVRLASRIA